MGAFRKLWHGVDEVSIKEIGARKFLVHFVSWKDMVRVLDIEPWTYMERLVLMSGVQPGRNAREVDGVLTSFWVQMHGIPLLNMTKVVAQKIRSVFIMDQAERHECIWRFVHVRIRMDVRHPLMRGTFVEFLDVGAYVGGIPI